jgi:hypothetical protein
MKNKFTFLSLSAMLFITAIAEAQTARVQVIHNSADEAAKIVDVYLNNTLIRDNFAFRTATPFLDVPAGVPVKIDVKGSDSTPATTPLYSISPTLVAGSKYILVADGIVSTTGYVVAPFGIEIYNMGRETATVATNTDILVHHGSTDAPDVDVNNVTGFTTAPSSLLVDNASYKAFAPYLELPTANYNINISSSDGKSVVQTYTAPLQGLGLNGKAITVVASGFLDPTKNSNGPAFGLWVALPQGGNLIPLPLAPARVQVIHNSADLAAKKVDVYIDDKLLLDDFEFRNASPFVDAKAGVPIKIDVKGSTSTPATQALYSISTTLVPGSTYILVADGIVSTTGYVTAPFGIEVYDMGREASKMAANTDVLVHHGSTDAPDVDVNNVTGFTTAPSSLLVDNASYKAFAPYIELPTANYNINISSSDGGSIVQTYTAPLQDLGLNGKAITVVASGFLDPTKNSNGPAFGLWVAQPQGGSLIPLPLAPARVQVIHNSADLAAKKVDVYIDDKLLLDDFEFRNASPFVDAKAGVPIKIDVKGSTSTPATQALYSISPTLVAGSTYILVADGIVSTTGYVTAPFGIEVYDMGREAAKVPENTAVMIHHGATDAPTVNVNNVTTSTSSIIADNLSYKNFSGYKPLLNDDYKINITTTGGAVVETYSAPLKELNLKGQAIVVVASGFLNPANNSNGPAFGLWVAKTSGGGLIELPKAPDLSTNEFEFKDVSVSPNPANDNLNINFKDFNDTSLVLTDVQGRNVLESKLYSESTSLSVSNLQKGMYILRLSNSNNSGSKVVKVLVK